MQLLDLIRIVLWQIVIICSDSKSIKQILFKQNHHFVIRTLDLSAFCEKYIISVDFSFEKTNVDQLEIQLHFPLHGGIENLIYAFYENISRCYVDKIEKSILIVENVRFYLDCSSSTFSKKIDFRANTYDRSGFEGESQCLTVQSSRLFDLMHTDSVHAIYRLFKVEIYNYQKISKTMSQTYQITLKVSDMKRLKVGCLENDFYLVALRQDQIQTTTKTQNVLFSDSPFQIESDEPIDRIEVWNYKGRSRIGSLLIKGALKSKKYSHVFQKSNLLIQIAKVNTDLSEQVRARNSQAKKSMNSTLHSSSQEDF